MNDNNPHFTRNVLIERKASGDTAKPLNLQIIKISQIEIQDDFHYFPHDHLYCEFIIPRVKDYECIINGSKIRVKPGQLVFVQPFDRHEDFYHQGGELIFMVCELYDLSGQLWRHGVFSQTAPLSDRTRNIDPGSPLENLLDFILNQSGENENQMLVREKIGEAFFWQFIATLPVSLLAPQFIGSLEQRIFQHRVIAYFMEIIHGQLNVKQLAVKFGMSKRSLEYKFRTMFDASPSHTFTAYKIRLATQMLENGDSVKTVAEQLGFSDQFYFSTVFKRFKGFPPSQVIKTQ